MNPTNDYGIICLPQADTAMHPYNIILTWRHLRFLQQMPFFCCSSDVSFGSLPSGNMATLLFTGLFEFCLERHSLGLIQSHQAFVYNAQCHIYVPLMEVETFNCNCTAQPQTIWAPE
ncbi:hypothetical protein XELAEV_18028025mg [Xenopus laevis]|uniref:Uncharacterized protein n=1 Tax=Xenopus laevis TaxID=8355 RepID=A0A974CYW9_XENLA|nr:hypothetical protein XELAEV_18028025mg [Xenopus laevis]